MTPRPTADDVTLPPTALSRAVALSGLTAAVSIIATNGPAGVIGMSCPAVSGVSDIPATVAACVSRRSAANMQPRGPYERQHPNTKLPC